MTEMQTMRMKSTTRIILLKTHASSQQQQVTKWLAAGLGLFVVVALLDGWKWLKRIPEIISIMK